MTDLIEHERIPVIIIQHKEQAKYLYKKLLESKDYVLSFMEIIAIRKTFAIIDEELVRYSGVNLGNKD